MSRQTKRQWYRARTLARLKALIPQDVPLIVIDGGWQFIACPLERDTNIKGRFEVVAAYIRGFCDAWAPR